MSIVLHLSDLHLGGNEPWERATDDKKGIVPIDENSRLAVLEASLKALGEQLKKDGLTLDAVAVTGDLTSQHDQGGFQRACDLFELLDIEPEKLIVVPGNHDVDWNYDADDPKKYAEFLRYTRAKKMATPYCDGVDSPDVPADPPARPIVELDDCIVVAINSANWCGVRFPGEKRKDRPHDLARVSEHQLDYLTDRLRDYAGDSRVRVAMVHHHLLPVTEDEEVKDFESFTNLARLRAWLRDHRFHVVLHGHKHSATLTWDYIFELPNLNTPPRRVLVVAAPRPRSWGEAVFRVIRTGDATGRKHVSGAPRANIDTFNAERPERPLDGTQLGIQLDGGTPFPPGVLAIDAETADAAYERLVDAFESQPADRLLNVTCVVRDAASAETLPTNFAGKPKVWETWLKDAVDWWQKASPALVASGDAPFNHGERLYTTGAGDNALDVAASRLGSTTAMVLLVRESELRPGSKAPAFVAVQLVRASDADGDRLDCVGYFRKQDVTLWWPVNLAELRAIQSHVLDLRYVEGVRPGRLVTMAVEAIADDVLPRLAGTKIDRAVDLNPELVMEMAYGAAHPTDGNREETVKLWTNTLRDIGGDSDFPSLGIGRLIEHLRVFREVGGLDSLEGLIKALEAVYNRAHRARAESPTRSARDAHAHDLFELVGEVLNELGETIGFEGEITRVSE
jgi:3',5'-cyclic AMP phosphodiesterase CpdA